jgi:hypothetical protein
MPHLIENKDFVCKIWVGVYPCSYKYTAPYPCCHPERSVAEPKDLRFVDWVARMGDYESQRNRLVPGPSVPSP